VFYGIATMLLAFVAANLGSIFQVTITVIGAFGGTLGGLFIMGLFLPCINKVVSAKSKWTIFYIYIW
jgi:sodium-coupled monocarboxylate transporter 8/12